MKSDLRNFIWELCLLPHKVKDQYKDKFQACLLGLEDMDPSEFFRIFDLRPGMKDRKCATCKWYMSGACYHPFMPMGIIGGIFSTSMGDVAKTLNPSYDEKISQLQEVDSDNLCNEWTDRAILDNAYYGISKFIDSILEDDMYTIGHDEAGFWNTINGYLDKGYGDQDSESIRRSFKNWITVTRQNFLEIYKEPYEYSNESYKNHQDKINKFKDILKFTLFTWWLRESIESTEVRV